MQHASPRTLVAEAVYGLPEVNREQIRNARVLANPGCYPTAVQLGFLPLIEAGWSITEHLIADAKSGVSGAGRKAEVASLLPRRPTTSRPMACRPPPSARDPAGPVRWPA
jgi:N-acetyl-gamma-glutamyl-phosphate reductase